MQVKLTETPENILKSFYSLKTIRDVAYLLEVNHAILIYHVRKSYNLKDRYVSFQIPKRSGENRTITAPATALKIIQKKLNQVLQEVYRPLAPVTGFVKGGSILKNAARHVKKKYVINLDLNNFFPAVYYGRVKRLFLSIPFKFNNEIATILSQICCYNNQLPQGAPSSPIVSNMICYKMDRALDQIATKHNFVYTRYADDLSFSSSSPRFSREDSVLSGGSIEQRLFEEIRPTIMANGFAINYNKVRVQRNNRRQMVTGLIVNEFPNVKRKFVRQIRAMLHAWRKYGINRAEKEFITKYSYRHRHPKKNALVFKEVVKGKIEFLGLVKGKDNGIYKKFIEEYRKLLIVA